MNKEELTLFNLGENLDSIMNMDPRGYGVCRILYDGARRFTGEPLSVHAAKGFVNNIKAGERVFILTGFVLPPWNEAETDGIISSTVFASFVIKAFSALPVMIVPEQCVKAINVMSAVLGVSVTDDLKNIGENTICVVPFTTDDAAAAEQADEILSYGKPCAVFSNEAPGRNKNGFYHNATGINTSDIEPKYDVLFNKCQKMGVYNFSIGDLGNEIGLGSIEEHIRKYIPYAELGGCKAGTGYGILVDTKADNILTATVSDWGCTAVMAAISFILKKPSLFITTETQSAVMDAAAGAGMLDMYGEARPYIDGIGKDFVLPMISMMRALIEYPGALTEKTGTWFEKTLAKGFFK